MPINVWKFVRKEIQAYQGLRDLVAEFYRRLAAGEPPPVSASDAGAVVHWVEKVARAADADHARADGASSSSRTRCRTWSRARRGSLGRATVARLRAEGHRVRVFQRRIPSRPEEGIEYAFGNLGDPVGGRPRGEGGRDRDPLRRLDEGRLARAQGRHGRRARRT